MAACGAVSSAGPSTRLHYSQEQTSWLRADGTTDQFRFRLLRPPLTGADAAGRAARFPLVVFLHGAGERGSDNESHLRHFPVKFEDPAFFRRYPCYVLAVQCRAGERWAPAGEAPDHPSLDLDRVRHAIRNVLAQEKGVDRERVYLTGLSMGGFGALALALREPELFAAVLAVCGGGDDREAARIAHLPIWLWHGSDDRVVPVARSREMVRALRAAGGEPRFTELAGVGHNSWEAAYGEDGALPWLFAQRR